MSDPTRDPLDQAIDRVAARLVSVDHDEPFDSPIGRASPAGLAQDRAMVDRIVAALPDRPASSGWGFLVPQAAVGICVALLAFAWINRDRGEEASLAGAAGTEVLALRTLEAGEVPALPLSLAPTPPSRVRASRPAPVVLVERPDHERSLTPVAALISIEVAALEAPSIPDEPPVVVAPLVLTELPLSGEMISPR